jgi:hypothetical protein
MDFLRTVLLVGTGALLWLVGSLIVAFPIQALSMDIAGIMKAFMTGQQHPVSVLILWMLDMVIALACLQDSKIRAGMSRWLGTLLTALLAYLTLAVFVPAANPAFTAGHPVAMATGALFCMLIARALSYSAPENARRVKTLPDGTGTNA